MSSDRPSRDEPSIRFPLERFKSLPPDIQQDVTAETFNQMAQTLNAMRASIKRESRSTRRALIAIGLMLLIPTITTLLMVGAYKERVDRMQQDFDHLRARVESHS